MNVEEIKALLDKYYEGQSSLEEELKLKEYFSHEDVPSELADEREIFRFYRTESEIPGPSSDFEDRILASIVSHEKPLARRRVFTVLSGIAAALLITAGVFLFISREKSYTDTYSDPEIAYNEAMKVLYDVSVKMNKGTKSLGKLSLIQTETTKSIGQVNRMTSLINDQMRPVDNALSQIKNMELTNEKK